MTIFKRKTKYDIEYAISSNVRKQFNKYRKIAQFETPPNTELVDCYPFSYPDDPKTTRWLVILREIDYALDAAVDEFEIGPWEIDAERKQRGFELLAKYITFFKIDR